MNEIIKYRYAFVAGRIVWIEVARNPELKFNTKIPYGPGELIDPILLTAVQEYVNHSLKFSLPLGRLYGRICS